MLSSVFAKNLYDMRRGLMGWSISILLMNLWIVTFFPAIRESASALDQYLQNLPPAFLALMGDTASFTTLEGFLSVELFAFFWPALTLAFAIASGAGSIGAEEESGTLDLLLSHPIPRWRLLLEKFAALMVFSGIAIGAGLLGLILGTLFVDEAIDIGNLAAAVLSIWLLTLLFATLTLALTGVGLRKGAAAGIGAGVAAISFLINTLGPLADLPETLRRVSPWHYYDGGAALTGGLSLGNSALLAGLVIAFLAVALFGFQRRDLAV